MLLSGYDLDRTLILFLFRFHLSAFAVEFFGRGVKHVSLCQIVGQGLQLNMSVSVKLIVRGVKHVCLCQIDGQGI